MSEAPDKSGVQALPLVLGSLPLNLSYFARNNVLYFPNVAALFDRSS
jgi:hypothetical protein